MLKKLLSRQTLRSLMVPAVTVVFAMAFIWLGHLKVSGRLSLFNESDRVTIVAAKVDTVLSRSTEQTALSGSEPVQSVTLKFKARIQSGVYKGLSVLALQQSDNLSPVQLKEVKEGDRVLLYKLEAPEEGAEWSMHEYLRTDGLLMLCLVFIGFLLLFGRGKGVNTIISLTFTCLAIFLVFIPSILAGDNIYASTVAICLFVVAVTILLVNGWNAKGLAAGIGCLGGLAMAGILTLGMSAALQLTGITDEESIYLLYMETASPIDLRAIIFASIVVGAMGATLDVAVSIASALSELCERSPGLRYAEIAKSGLNIGRDVMGTMSNTLILAYTGSTLSLSLLLIVYSNSLLQLLNRELIVVELLQALIGSIGLLFTIPLTSAASAFVFTGARPFRRPAHPPSGEPLTFEEKYRRALPSESAPAAEEPEHAGEGPGDAKEP